MPSNEDLDAILKRFEDGTQTEADVAALRQLLRGDGRSEVVQQLAKYNIYLDQAEGIQIGDHYYCMFDEKMIEALLKALQGQKRQERSPQTSLDFHKYLRTIIEEYEHWWDQYVLTEVIAEQQAKFTFDQRVQTEEPRQEDSRIKEKISFPVLQGVADYVAKEPVLLVGSPGAGKSTTLLRLLVDVARREIEKQRPQIPVLIRLKDYQKPSPDSEDASGLLTLIQEALKAFQPGLSLTLTEVEALLFDDETRLFLLLDGLNEVSAENNYSKLIDFQKRCRRANVPFVCTTRSLGHNILGIKRKLELKALEPQEVKRFLGECMPDKAQEVLELLSKNNQELRNTPFVLWMLYDIFQRTSQVPESLGEAFRQFTEAFTHYKIDQEGIPVSEVEIQHWELRLQYLAFEMLNSPDPKDPGILIHESQAIKKLTQFPYGKSTNLDGPLILNNLQKYHLLQKSHKGEISFCHQLLQEYYAAEWLLIKLPEFLKSKENQNRFKSNHLNYLKWEESIALMLSLSITDEETISIIDIAIDDVDLMLGARLAGEVKSSLQEQALEMILGKFVDTYPIQPAWLKLALLKKVGTRGAAIRLIPLLNHADYKVRSFTYLWLRENFLEIVPETSRYQEEIKRLHYLPKNSGLSPELDDTQPLLDQQTLEHMSSKVRAIFDSWSNNELPTQVAVTQLASLLKTPDYLTQWSAVTVLSCIKTPLSASILLQEVEEPQSLVAGEAALVLGDFEDVMLASQLVEIFLRCSNPEVRSRIIYALKTANNKDRISAISLGVKDVDTSVRRAAIEMCWNINSSELVPCLIETISDSDSQIRRLAADRLQVLSTQDHIAKILNEKYLQILILNLEHSDIRVRWEVCLTLWNILLEESVSLLSPMLEHHDFGLCAALLLGKFGYEAAAPKLIQLISLTGLPNIAEVPDILYLASYALGKIPDGVTTEYLPKLFTLVSTQSGEAALRVITSIQSRCKFYKYVLYQQAQSQAEESDRPQQTSTVHMHFYKEVEVAVGNVEGNLQRSPTWTTEHPIPVDNEEE